MLQAGLLAWLIAYRVVAPEGGAPGRVAMLALAIGAAAATAAGEALWYGLATGISGWLVLPANWDLELLPRPSTWVLGAGLLLATLRALPRRRAPRARAVPAPA
jgi:sulfoxide reductase heme-binding subunit YedZ